MIPLSKGVCVSINRRACKERNSRVSGPRVCVVFVGGIKSARGVCVVRKSVIIEGKAKTVRVGCRYQGERIFIATVFNNIVFQSVFKIYYTSLLNFPRRDYIIITCSNARAREAAPCLPVCVQGRVVAVCVCVCEERGVRVT